MPLDTALRKVLVIGSGPIVIAQGGAPITRAPRPVGAARSQGSRWSQNGNNPPPS